MNLIEYLKKRTYSLFKLNLKLGLSILVILFSLGNIYASDSEESKNIPQSIINRTVTDQDGVPIPGANILIENTTIGVHTDFDGKFTITAAKGDVLVFSFLGMTTKSVEVGDDATVNVTLVSDASELDEVIIVGYGSQKKSTITGAVSNMKGEEIQDVPTSNLSNVLAGRMAGLTVVKDNGLPGVGSSIKIRNSGTWNSNPVLYVIDGVVRGEADFNRLDPNEVAEITILKDAASAAVYGARSAGGVLVVKTKQGEKGKAKIDFSYNYSFENPTVLPSIIENAEEAALLGNTAIYNFHGDAANGRSDWWSKDEIDWIKEQNGGKIISWLDLAYQDPTSQQYSLSVSGGSDNIRYYFGGSIFGQTGFMSSISFDKYNVRSSIEADISENLTLGLQFSRVNSEKDRLNRWLMKLDIQRKNLMLKM